MCYEKKYIRNNKTDINKKKKKTEKKTRADIAQLPFAHAHTILQGGYCATFGCACAHPKENRMGQVTFGHFR
jgi:hypothetical protein